uniref:Uncharacterized protein n=1 Tax=Meloidogyne enterolobii TaxID=390850 RepID=A0A6V7X0G2_MELEN|nr:unnamed protein product [Meloidogyne enterolobii]
MSIKLFIFFVFIIKIVNCGNFCGKPQVDEDDNDSERFVGNEGGLHEGDVIDFEEGFGPQQVNLITVGSQYNELEGPRKSQGPKDFLRVVKSRFDCNIY